MGIVVVRIQSLIQSPVLCEISSRIFAPASYTYDKQSEERDETEDEGDVKGKSTLEIRYYSRRAGNSGKLRSQSIHLLAFFSPCS